MEEYEIFNKELGQHYTRYLGFETNMVKKFNSKFRVGQGGLLEVSSDITLGEGEDELVLVDASGGPVTITLQRADGSGGKRFCIKKVDSSANVVTVEPQPGQTIDGGASETVSAQNEFVDLVSDNENWVVIGVSQVGTAIPHDFLSATHLDTVPATPPDTGSLAKGDGANLWAEFVIGAGDRALLVNAAGNNLIYALIKNANVDPTAAIAQSKLAAIALGDLPNLPALGVAPASPRQTNIVNAEVDPGAAIAQSKLAPIALGDLPNLPALGVAPASPRQVDIVNAEIAVAAAIAQSKIAGLVTALGTKVETSSDVGAGVGKITKAKVANDLPFKSILAGAGITINNLTDEIEIVSSVVNTFVLGMGSNAALGSGSQFKHFFGEGHVVAEGDAQSFLGSAFTIKRHTVRVNLNSSNNVVEFTVRDDGADVPNTLLSIPASTTGSFDTGVITEVVAAASLIAHESNRTGTAAVNDIGIMVECEQ